MIKSIIKICKYEDLFCYGTNTEKMKRRIFVTI